MPKSKATSDAPVTSAALSDTVTTPTADVRELDPDLVAACASLEIDPALVLAYNIREDHVAVIDGDGRKFKVER